MATVTEELVGKLRCDRCGYEFRKNDQYNHDAALEAVCVNEKNCRRRQRTPKPEYANPDASVDEMLDKIASTLTDEVRTLMMHVSEDETLLRYVYRECFSSGQFVKSWKR